MSARSVGSSFLHEEVAYRYHRGEVATIVDVTRRLPQLPFRQPYLLQGFDDMDWAMSAEFWQVLQDLAVFSNDNEVVIGVIDPDPETCFKKHYGYYNWASLSVAASNEDYWYLINHSPAASPADSILVNAEVVIITAPSKAWAVWCQRDTNLCLLALIDSAKKVRWNGIDWLERLHSNEDWVAFTATLRDNIHRHQPDSPL